MQYDQDSPWKDILTFYLPKLPAKNPSIESNPPSFGMIKVPKTVFLDIKKVEKGGHTSI